MAETVDCEGWRSPLRCKQKIDPALQVSGYCEDCYRHIDDINLYRAYREEGYSVTQAGLMAGLTDPPGD